MLTGAAAAGGIAMIGAVGNLGGWLGPFVFGMIKDASSDTVALLFLASATVMSAICVLVVGHDRRLERIPPRL
jgi:nitrate/nitrite transporter NarK